MWSDWFRPFRGDQPGVLPPDPRDIFGTKIGVDLGLDWHKWVLVLVVVMAGQWAWAAPAPGVMWDWQLSEPVKPPKVVVFDTDPDAVNPALIKRLRANGVYTICYVSVGTVENYRDDVGAFPAGVVGRTYGDWPDEKFLDIRQLDVILPIMKARFQRCKDMGFAAVEPDNMDVYDNDTGFGLNSIEGLIYIKALADMAHGMGLEIGQKNVPDLTGDLVRQMDFVITESCYQDGWCDEVAAYTRAGKPVFDAEYTDEPIDFAKACAVAKALNISMILKDRDLNAGGQSCNE